MVMREEALTEDQIKIIREEVLNGKSRWRIAHGMGLDFLLVDSITKDLPYKRRKGPCIYGKAFNLLQQLLLTGVVLSTDETRETMRRLRRHFPMICYARFEDKGMFYLEDKNKKALQSVIDRSKSRIISYQDLGRMLQIFNIEVDSGEKKAFLGRKLRGRKPKIRVSVGRPGSVSQEKQAKIDEFLGRF